MLQQSAVEHSVVTRGQHLALYCTVTCLRLWYRLRYDVQIVGYPEDVVPNCVVMTNHRSTRDSFLFDSLLFGKYAWRQPWLLPWNAPKRKWYTTVWPIRTILSLFRTVSVRIGDDNQPRDPVALRTLLRLLRSGNVVHIFPEGTRSHTEEMRPLQPSACSLPLLAGSSIMLAYYIRRGRARIIAVGSRYDPSTVSTMAGAGNVKDRAQQLAEQLHKQFAVLRRIADSSTAS